MEKIISTEAEKVDTEHTHDLTKRLRYSLIGLLSGISLYLPSITSAQVTDTYVKLISPNGGEDLRVGDNTQVIWEKSNNVSDCNISYLTKNPGSYQGGETLTLIDRAYTGTGVGEPRMDTYSWRVDVGSMDDSGTKQIKIDLLCYVTNGTQINTQSADFITISQ